MFEVGFSEILVIFVLALVVLGPEKLPKLASQIGRWVGRARSMARQFKDQLEEEVRLEDVRKAQADRPKPPGPAAAAQETSAALPAAATSNVTTAPSAGKSELIATTADQSEPPVAGAAAVTAQGADHPPIAPTPPAEQTYTLPSTSPEAVDALRPADAPKSTHERGT